MAVPSEREIVGEPPSLAGLRCEGMVCQAFVWEGEVIEDAQIIHMQFGGEWHRLYFDFGIIFWKKSTQNPLPWEDIDADFTYYFRDVGNEFRIVGGNLKYYHMDVLGSIANVTFGFEGGPVIVFENRDDRTNFRVLSSE